MLLVTKDIPGSLNVIHFGGLAFQRILQMYFSKSVVFFLNIVLLSPDPEIKNSEIALSRSKRITNLFSNPMFKVYNQFLNSALESLINRNHWCQRYDPIMYVIYNWFLETLCMLLSRSILLVFVTELTETKLTTLDVEISDKYLLNDSMFKNRNFLELLFDDGDINQKQHNKYRFLCWSFHKISFVYALKRFPLDNDVLKHCRILNFHNQRYCFEIAQRLIESF